MPVYVDQLNIWGGDDAPRCFRHKPSCHMYADSIKELHNLAQKIGLKREWFQDHSLLPHYDVVPSKRLLAIKNGAVEVDRYHLVNYVRNKRQLLANLK